jgi:hypothetical protein
MKWASLSLFVLAFPLAIWIFAGARITKLDPSSAQSRGTGSQPNRVSERDPAPRRGSDLDLRKASSATIKKIKEIDTKIESARLDLQRSQAARQVIIKDLIKIQAKIDSVIQSQPQL